MDFRLQNGKFIYKQEGMQIEAGFSLTKRDFQITKEMMTDEMGFLDYKRESRFAIHLKINQKDPLYKKVQGIFLTKNLFALCREICYF